MHFHDVDDEELENIDFSEEEEEEEEIELFEKEEAGKEDFSEFLDVDEDEDERVTEEVASVDDSDDY
jgi:hypothetical protein